jgi:uncharacterized phage-associated protein
MHSVFDVAQYILNAHGEMTAMKLQKLCYYSQAWSLAWDDVPLFPEDFEAWANGPVCPELFDRHRGRFTLESDFLGTFTQNTFNDTQKETLNIVLDDYAHMKPHELSVLTHIEYPWRWARGDTQPGMPCNKIIEKDVMKEYYTGLIPTE